MKPKLGFLPLFAACAAFVMSCTEEEPKAPTELAIVPSVTELSFDAAVFGSESFTVSTDAESWDAVSETEWINIDKSDAGFTVSCSVNTSYDDRSGVVTVTSGDASPVNINVLQRGLQIYMGGNENGIAAYWHNGQKELIGTGNATYINDMYVDGSGNIYVVGRAGFGTYFCGFYWNSNSGWQDIIGLLDAENAVNVSAVAVDESTGDIYYSAYEGWTNEDWSQTWVAYTVKNFVEMDQLTEDGVSQAGDVAFYDGDLYTVMSGDKVGYMKNGDFTALDMLGEGIYPSDMYIHDGDVYIGGWYLAEAGGEYIYAPCYWINGKAVNVSSEEYAQIYCIYVDEEGNIWLGGSVGSGLDRAAAYWKNGEKTLLTDLNNACLSGIFARDGVVIAAGFERGDTGNTVLKYWVNGEETAVTDGTMDSYCEVMYVR